MKITSTQFFPMMKQLSTQMAVLTMTTGEFGGSTTK